MRELGGTQTDGTTGRLMPRSRRGQRTRAALLAAAREVFDRDGFVGARISDISETAGVATGSFYTYFTDKDEILTAVLAEVEEEMLHPGVHNAPDHDDPVKLVEMANRAYLDSYRRNVRLMMLLEQVASIDDDFRALRRRRAMSFVRRNARGIERLQEQGKADPSIDPLLASVALSSMVSRTAHMVFALRAHDADFEELVQMLTTLWVRALNIEPDG